MKKINRTFKLLFTTAITGILFSCNVDDREPVKEEGAQATDTATTMKAAPESTFTAFDIAEISHTVKDYARWRPFFNADSVNRIANGMKDMVVGRGADNINKVVIALEVSDVQKAKNFGADPKLKEVMDKAGVTSKPDIQFFHVLRFNPESKEKNGCLLHTE